jgi:hypothetical protein
MFKPHIAENTKKRLERSNTDMVPISGNFTSLVQSRDAFARFLRAMFMHYGKSGHIPAKKSFTKGGNIHAALLNVL